jgi:CBS domain containing-hemolysin-like protein
MGEFTVLVACGLVALLLRGIHQAYFRLPTSELKRSSSRTKPSFRQLYAVARYGLTAHIFFGLLEFVFAGATVIILSRAFDPLTALVFLGVFLALWEIISRRRMALFESLAAKASPLVVQFLKVLEPLVDIKKSLPLRRRYRVVTDIYEREDLRELIDRQRRAINNRIPEEDLESLLRVLESEAKKVKDIMVPRKNIKFVTPKDPIGPILLSELHKNGFSCFPVKGNSENEIVGMLPIEGLSDHTAGGTVADVMDKHVFYVRQDKGLEEVLKAFNKTGRRMFIVINEDEKIVGLITVKDVLERLLGQSLHTDFENFGDPKSVAEE